MAGTQVERNQPILLQTGSPPEAERTPGTAAENGRIGVMVLTFALAFSAFWIGVTAAFAFGYFGTRGLASLPLTEWALLAFATFLPPLLMISSAWAFSRGTAMADAATALASATENLFAVDDTASKAAARLGRSVRRELDGLNAGLDGAFARLRALESVLDQQIAAIDEAGARMDVRGEAVAARLTQERERIEGVTTALTDAASRASETVAGRAAQLKAMIESAESNLKNAGQSLDTYAASFRQAAQQAADAPKNAVVELDAQAKRIESVSDAAMARAEFVLGRHERHRSALGELLDKLKAETTGFEGALGAQRTAIEHAVGMLSGEAKRFEIATGDADRQLDVIMANASARAIQLSQSYGREVERLGDSADAANASLTKLVDSLREAGSGAQALIGETTGQAKNDAKSVVGEAMAECDKLLRAAGELSIEAGAIRQTLSQAVNDIERHLLALPSIAAQEAQRVRDVVRSETEAMLDHSARTLSTVHARSTTSAPVLLPPQVTAPLQDAAEGKSLIGLARKITQRPRKKGDPPDLRESKPWEMKELLAAVNSTETRELKPGSAAALGALEAAMSDLAIDLGSLCPEIASSDETWQRYLKGDRSVFARRIADTIDSGAVDRISDLYRNDQHFREAANTYIAEYESLLSRASESDQTGLLASTMLSADTGKIYLAVAYALGKL